MTKTGLLCLAMIAPGLALADGDHYVYTLLNQAGGNAVQTYKVSDNGHLVFQSMTYTGGLGTSAGLGSQGALSLSANGRYLTVVNAGNNTVSTFYIKNGKPELTDVEPSGGLTPTSVTESEGLVYVLNQGSATVAGNVQGFARFRGGLVPIPGATAPVSGVGAIPVEVKFTPDGDGLVVAEKNTNLIDTFKLDYRGLPVDLAYQTSVGVTPFGFDFDRRGRLFITEANGGAANASSVSSYRLASDLALTAISSKISTNQTAACWDVVSPNGKFLYTGNAGSGSVSGYRIAHDGTISLLKPSGVSGTTGAHTLDVTISSDGAFLFVLSAGNQEITSFRVADDGSLSKVDIAADLPVGTTGLVAR